ncbi:MAG: hypothetical protein IPP07_23720 [Holophagales bacterium]|nr:hypothetical protein [Holophagales bacterium]
MLDSSTSIQWLGADILTTLVFLPSLGALVLLFLSNEAKNAIRAVGLLASGATFAVSVAVLQKFNPAIAGRPSGLSSSTGRGSRASGSAT